MGCKLIRGETIYFIRHGGPTVGDLDRERFAGQLEETLPPPVYTRSDGHVPDGAIALPVEARIFEAA